MSTVRLFGRISRPGRPCWRALVRSYRLNGSDKSVSPVSFAGDQHAPGALVNRCLEGSRARQPPGSLPYAVSDQDAALDVVPPGIETYCRHGYRPGEPENNHL